MMTPPDLDSEFVALTEAEARAIFQWWFHNREGFSEWEGLRASSSPTENLQYSIVAQLTVQLGPRIELLSVAAIAGLVANVDQDEPATGFICQLGKLSGASKPPRSEIHFTHLQKSKSVDEFYQRLQRAIIMLQREVDVISLADCSLHWLLAHTPEYNARKDLGDLLEQRWQAHCERGVADHAQ